MILLKYRIKIRHEYILHRLIIIKYYTYYLRFLSIYHETAPDEKTDNNNEDLDKMNIDRVTETIDNSKNKFKTVTK